jgi:hypothetical protein
MRQKIIRANGKFQFISDECPRIDLRKGPIMHEGSGLLFSGNKNLSCFKLPIRLVALSYLLFFSSF